MSNIAASIFNKKTAPYLIAGGVLGLGAVLLLNRKVIQRAVWDVQTTLMINALHPKVRSKFKSFVNRVERETGIRLFATSGFRSWAKQAALHIKNSKNPSAGRSMHNYGFAMDFNAIKPDGSHIKKASSKAEWKPITDIAKKMGFEWGGDYRSYYDPVHFEIDHDINKLYALHEKGYVDKKGYIKLVA